MGDGFGLVDDGGGPIGGEVKGLSAGCGGCYFFFLDGCSGWRRFSPCFLSHVIDALLLRIVFVQRSR